MNKLFIRSNLGFAIACAIPLPMMISSNPAKAEPIKKCPPVVRSLKTKKLYCAHELKVLQKEKEAGFLCFFLRAIIPPNDWLKANQCFPKANFSSETGKKIIPKPKGSRTALKFLKPIGTFQLTAQPTITWQSIPNANYRVTLEQGGQWLWSKEINGTEVKIPNSHSLIHGKQYKLTVVALKNNQTVAEEKTNLQLVDPKQLREIDDAILTAQQVAPDPLDRGLDKAMMFYHLGLLDAAVATLLSLIPNQEPEVYSQLGLIHKEVGQLKIAQGYFDKAIELANQTDQPFSRVQ